MDKFSFEMLMGKEVAALKTVATEVSSGKLSKLWCLEETAGALGLMASSTTTDLYIECLISVPKAQAFSGSE